MTNAVTVAQGASNNVTFRNRLINGACVIDQRNAGAPVTTTGTYPVDRFQNQITYGSLSFQQSSTAPAGFKNSVAVTVTTGGTVSASDRNALAQWIEGYNIADLDFGTASAKSVTLSFWVRSSLTGTFSGCLSNNVINRSFVFTYTISAANTWEQKTVTIVGETTGTWQATTGQGLRVAFDLGTGTDRLTSTTNTWQSADYRGATGAVQLSNTSGATFYITGVQLEAGTTASPFEYRQYGQELALCQRYYQIIRSNAAYQFYTLVTYESSSTAWGPIPLKVSMRSQPTTLVSGSFTVSYGTQGTYINDTNQTGAEVAMIGWGGTGSGGTVGYSPYIRSNNNTTSYMSFSAEL